MIKIERMGVVGAGQMGRGIAQIAAAQGLDVTLVDASPGLAEKGRAAIATQLARLVDKGKLTAAERDAQVARQEREHGGSGVEAPAAGLIARVVRRRH